MAFDGKILALAKAALDEKRQRHEQRYQRSVEAVYNKSPRVREIDEQLRATMAALFGAALTNGGSQKIEDIRARNLALQQERDGILQNLHDAIIAEYMCESCRDTGYDGLTICQCLMAIYKTEQKKELSSLLNLGSETFERFRLDLYDDTPGEAGISARLNMEIIFETCYEYAHKFGDKSPNLLLCGAPGLGKTFLSAAIARVVADGGFSVVYDMAANVFAKFEDVKFSRASDMDAARRDMRRYLECDLLILDDLGTEMTTAFTVSALYEIINTRLITGKKTIVSTNLTADEIGVRYSEQIASRLLGQYHVLTFRGDDIRRKLR